MLLILLGLDFGMVCALLKVCGNSAEQNERTKQMRNAILRLSDWNNKTITKIPVTRISEAQELVRDFSMEASGEFLAHIVDDEGFVAELNPNGTIHKIWNKYPY